MKKEKKRIGWFLLFCWKLKWRQGFVYSLWVHLRHAAIWSLKQSVLFVIESDVGEECITSTQHSVERKRKALCRINIKFVCTCYIVCVCISVVIFVVYALLGVFFVFVSLRVDCLFSLGKAAIRRGQTKQKQSKYEAHIKLKPTDQMIQQHTMLINYWLHIMANEKSLFQCLKFERTKKLARRMINSCGTTAVK